MKRLKINCTKNGIRVYGAKNIGSTCDTDAGTRQDFMRIAEHWWNTYCRDARRREHPEQFNPANGEPHTKKWLKEQREAGLRRKR